MASRKKKGNPGRPWHDKAQKPAPEPLTARHNAQLATGRVCYVVVAFKPSEVATLKRMGADKIHESVANVVLRAARKEMKRWQDSRQYAFPFLPSESDGAVEKPAENQGVAMEQVGTTEAEQGQSFDVLPLEPSDVTPLERDVTPEEMAKASKLIRFTDSDEPESRELTDDELYDATLSEALRRENEVRDASRDLQADSLGVDCSKDPLDEQKEQAPNETGLVWENAGKPCDSCGEPLHFDELDLAVICLNHRCPRNQAVKEGAV